MEQALKSEITRQAIINKAFTLFYENGFKTTSIKTIMQATQLSKGAFYHHYKNKQEIGLEVINQKVQKRLYEKMIAPMYKDGNVIEILENTFLTRMKSMPDYDKKHGCSMNNLINEIGDFETVYQKALKELIEEWKTAIVTLLERGKTENSIKKESNSKAIAMYLISAFEGVRGIRKLYNDDAILDEYMAGLSLYLQQLKA